MKSKLLLSLLLLGACFPSSAQVAYQDALRLKPLFDNLGKDVNKFNEITVILSQYLSEAERNAGLNKDKIRSIYSQNPFIPKTYSGFKIPNGPVNIAALSSKAFSAIGGIDVTNIANALSQVMIKRAKEELTVAFFNRFKKFADSNKEFGVLFPKTTDNLRNLLTYKYPQMLPALRTGFFEDLKTITYHLDDVLELPRYQGLLRNFPEIKIAIRSIRLVQEIESGETYPADILSKFASFAEWKGPNVSKDVENFGSSVKLADIFSNSLRKTNASPGSFFLVDSSKNPILKESVNITIDGDLKEWISFKEMQLLVKDSATFRIYLGLIYQLAKRENIRFHLANTQTIAFSRIMEEQQDNVFLFQNKVTEFVELANKVDKLIDTIKAKGRPNITQDNAYDYIDASLDVIEYGFSIAQLFKEDLQVELYTKIARKSNDLYRNIYKQEYTQAVSNAMDVLTEVNRLVSQHDETALVAALKGMISKGSKMSDKFKTLEALAVQYKNKAEEIRQKAEAFRISGEIEESDLELLKYKLQLDTLANVAELKSYYYFQRMDTILQKLTKYGLFMANMVNAKDADQIAAVIDNAILPVGSSSIKKYADFNISIQSYLGGFYRVGTMKQEFNNAWSSRFGVTAPIGLSFSYGLKKGGALSLFGSIIDLGAIVDYQLKKDSVVTSGGTTAAEVKKNYEVKLGQIFSPGVFLVYGFGGNIPLALGFGGQYGPGLGKIETNNSTVVNNPQWRFNLFLAVDIPFFNIMNRQKKYKQ